MEKNLAKRISNMIEDVDTRKTAAICILKVSEVCIYFTAEAQRITIP